MKKEKSVDLSKIYFGEKEELAVLEYLYSSDPNGKEKVFREVLYPAFLIMVESQIKRYRFMRDDISVDDLIKDTLSFLLTKFDKFKPDYNKKAYSYYGTICVNYLKTEIEKRSKEKNKNISYEDISSDLIENSKLAYELQIDKKLEVIDFIPFIVDKIKDELETNKKLKINEKKVGIAIVQILENWENMFDPEDRSNILARNKILLAIREYTFLSPKDVRSALKKFKVIYEVLKNEKYNDD